MSVTSKTLRENSIKIQLDNNEQTRVELDALNIEIILDFNFSVRRRYSIFMVLDYCVMQPVVLQYVAYSTGYEALPMKVFYVMF